MDNIKLGMTGIWFQKKGLSLEARLFRVHGNSEWMSEEDEVIKHIILKFITGEGQVEKLSLTPEELESLMVQKDIIILEHSIIPSRKLRNKARSMMESWVAEIKQKALADIFLL